MEEQKAGPALLVIFGITGDLAKRKLLPALYHLMRDNLLHPDTQIIGVTRQKLSKDDVLAPLDKYTASAARPSPTALRRFKHAFHLLNSDIASVEGYKELKVYLNRLEKNFAEPAQRLYYLSIPPAVLDEVVSFMSQAGLQHSFKGGPKPALLIEKPFGYDLDSAKELIKCLKQSFAESQLYRIDHYLAKEMAQNILDFRLYNPLFAAVWSKQHIDKVVITAHEKIGIEGRAQFYEQTGALRDLIQSHLLQLLCLVAMEPPAGLDSGSIHQKRIELLKSIVPFQPYEISTSTLRGQYDGYKDEVGSQRTATETYAAVHLRIGNDRWGDTPFLLRTGKAVHEKRTDIEVHFGSNVLTLTLQPEESIQILLHHKKPGHGHESNDAGMEFNYKRTYPGVTSPEAYERVLLDAIRQDQTLFASSEEVLASWRFVMPILDEWAKASTGLLAYEKGSEAPSLDGFDLGR